MSLNFKNWLSEEKINKNLLMFMLKNDMSVRLLQSSVIPNRKILQGRLGDWIFSQQGRGLTDLVMIEHLKINSSENLPTWFHELHKNHRGLIEVHRAPLLWTGTTSHPALQKLIDTIKALYN